MKLLNLEVLRDFKNRHRDASAQVDAWEAEVVASEWDRPSDIKYRYATASILKDNIVIFNIKGNQYRIKVQVNYPNKIVFLKNAGTHDEYMKW